MLTVPGTDIGKQWSLIWDWIVTVLLYVVRSWGSTMSNITFIPSTGLICMLSTHFSQPSCATHK